MTSIWVAEHDWIEQAVAGQAIAAGTLAIGTDNARTRRGKTPSSPVFHLPPVNLDPDPFGDSMQTRALAVAAAVTAAAIAAPAVSAHDDTTNHTITGDGSPGFEQLVDTGAGWPRIIREDIAAAGANRATGRTSLLYAGQLTDFQLSDEESPARVEFLDVNHPQNPASAAQRPQEALLPFLVDQAIRALNLDMDTSPHGTGAELELTLVTGDQADSQQRNEVEWVVKLLEGGHLKPNSGVEDNLPICGANGEADKYTGVQDYDDYLESGSSFYDPDQPTGNFADWPNYHGLMDRAQRPFQAAGADKPTYVTNGNHDSLVQGNSWANTAYEAVATGCSKVFAPVLLQDLAPTFPGTSPENIVDVPRDPKRQYVDKAQTRALHATGAQADAHGYAFVEAAELAASNGAASYYAFSPKAGIRIVSIDTVSEGGVIAESSNGNIDDPQFQWLSAKLDELEDEHPNDLVIVMGHHPIRALTSRAPDELAAQCTVDDAHGHDVNPGCDADPRISEPLHDGAGLQSLLLAHPNVIAYVTGHTHEHNIDPFVRADGSGGFWGIETSAIVDWPVQGRVIEVTDNGDDTLSIFGTVFDHDGPVTGPAPPISNSNPLTPAQLASIGRTIAYNDPQAGAATGLGLLEDRNVELILPDPR